MNRESFNDEEVAKILNQSFIPIKVDREERPDIDKVYMTFSEAMTGSGGWPLNIITTPEGKPFFIGTYFPKKSRNRMTGIIDMLDRMNSLWLKENRKVLDESNHIFNEVLKFADDNIPGDINESIYKNSKDTLEELFDNENGGFGHKPKFPMPQYILFLLNYYEKESDKNALKIAEITLENMYKGGLFDHIGYGFFRYSVDEKFLVPHFEKMLYDNALLLLAYTKAYEITKKELYKTIAEKIIEFVIRDLLQDGGGFYSALDADSEGEEGKYYLFDYNEAIDILGEEWGGLFNYYYNISKKGNFEGKNIPNLINMKLEDMNPNDAVILDSVNQMLFSYREKRVPPHRDEKILTSWNGLIIGSLSYAGRIFNNEFYIKKAKESADYILKNAIDGSGNLLSTTIDDHSYNYGFLEDYSFFIYGLLNLFKAQDDKYYLDMAIKLTSNMLDIFKDINGGGLYFYGKNSEELVLKLKDFYDGAIPSGNGFVLNNLMTLFILTGDEKYINTHKKILHSFGENINNSPLAYLYSILSLSNFL